MRGHGTGCAFRVAKVLVVAVDPDACLGWASWSGSTDTCRDGGDDLFTQGEEGGDGPGSLFGHVVATGSLGFDHDLFTAQFPQIVGGLADGVSLFLAAGQ